MFRNGISSSIIKIDNLMLMENIIKTIPENSLIIFDVDNVLIMPIPDLRTPCCLKLWKKIEKRQTKERVILLMSIIIKFTNYVLTDNRVIDILNYLRKKHIPTMASTAISTGSYGFLKNIENMRINNLQKIGINFYKSTPVKDLIYMPELQGINMIYPNCIGIPTLKSGIIFTAGTDKALSLEYVFNKKNYYPKTIVFIDDELNNLKSVKQLCRKLNINFYGIHYIALSKMPLPNIDCTLEKLRYAILEEEFCWLCDDELKDIIKKMSYEPFDKLM